MQRDCRVYLQDILEAVERILRYTNDSAEPDFIKNDQLLDAVVRNLEIIGEAVKGVPSDICKAYPEVEWKKLAGLRDILIHKYFDVDEEIISDIISNKLPGLKTQIMAILAKEAGK